jgi:hypothetical protein
VLNYSWFCSTDFGEKTLAGMVFGVVQKEARCLFPKFKTSGEEETGSANDTERASVLEFHKRYGVRIRAHDDVDVFTLPLKTSLCPVEWDSQSERVFVDGRATARDLLDLSEAIGSRISYLKRVHGHQHLNANQFVFRLVSECWFAGVDLIDRTCEDREKLENQEVTMVSLNRS